VFRRSPPSKPENIAGVRRGNEATVQAVASDYTIYGTPQGDAVKLISG